MLQLSSIMLGDTSKNLPLILHMVILFFCKKIEAELEIVCKSLAEGIQSTILNLSGSIEKYFESKDMHLEFMREYIRKKLTSDTRLPKYNEFTEITSVLCSAEYILAILDSIVASLTIITEKVTLDSIHKTRAVRNRLQEINKSTPGPDAIHDSTILSGNYIEEHVRDSIKRLIHDISN